MPARTLTASQPSGGTAHAIQVVLYARVSSEDQAKEGFYIPAQQRLLREYAITEHINVLEEFVDVETASHSGRLGFRRHAPVSQEARLLDHPGGKNRPALSQPKGLVHAR